MIVGVRVWFGPLGLSVVTGSASAQGFSACLYFRVAPASCGVVFL